MSALTQLPHKPYRSLWVALAMGCLVASAAVAVFSSLRGASSGAGLFFFVLYISFAAGAGITLLVAMPLLWLLIRIGYAGPVSAIAFSCALFALVGYPDYRGAGVMLVFIVSVLCVFLLAAYTKLFSNNRFERSRVSSSVGQGGGR
jgi:peptidoglycan/LPS O-acetylase OafA/YrhL